METKQASITDDRKRTELKEQHPSWVITFDASGNINGLPEGISQKDVIAFLGNDGKWYAQDLSPELLKEIRQWRTDWL